MADPYPHFLPELYNELDGCATRQSVTPSKLRRFFLLMLRGHWSDVGNYGPDLEDSLSCLYWRPDKEKTLGVELQGNMDADQLQNMVWVALGGFQVRGKLTFSNLTAISEDNATTTQVIPVTASLNVHHDAPHLDQAFDMAWSSFCFLQGFQPSILDALGNEGAAFDVQAVQEPKQEEKIPKGSFRVDVLAALSLNVAVDTTLESHRLKRVALTIQQQ